ncbi:MAG: phosphatidate cytidylyltransferase [Natronospirillum sp.]|uniref:phosphatidate cytidylyltransferase n=1 Tax=Natronospirillum sp. TaxID=2812955 RepID=UPI0025DD4A8D|nr:phosphatidate cytidylyltransferase [Natronospirillum sp.]MCH8552324.1 phosphatidate cytidylyltransferase [Natronospirillum sp.]
MVLNDRVKTALVLIPLMLGAIYLLPLSWFALAMAVIAVFGAWEWADLSGCGKIWQRLLYQGVIAVLLGLVYWLLTTDQLAVQWLLGPAVVWWLVGWLLVKGYPEFTSLWANPSVRLLMGALILLSMWVGFYWIVRADDSRVLITLLMLLVWGADVGAYYSGRRFGRRKLAPQVSPGKTWEGVVGGMAGAAVLALLLLALFTDLATWRLLDYVTLVLFAASVVTISVVGDLVESMVKRHRGLKDSGRLLPGHGGVMDRIDSMCAAAPVFAAFVVLWPALQLSQGG